MRRLASPLPHQAWEDHSYNPELVDKGIVEWLERIMLLGFDPDDKVGPWETSEFDENMYNDEVSADDKGNLIGQG